LEISDFVDAKDFQNAPSEDVDAFRYFALSANEKFREQTGQLRDIDEDWEALNAARVGFHNYIMAIGCTYDVAPFNDPQNVPPAQYANPEWLTFKGMLDYRLAMLMHARAKAERTAGFLLTVAAKKGFRTHLAGLRKYIDESDLPPKKKKELLAKVAEFEAALEGRRMNMTAVWLFAGFLLGNLADFAQIADSDIFRSLVTGVVKVANEAKEASDEMLTLAAPTAPLRIAGPTPVQSSPAREAFTADLDDDEISF
jgi:hypothetical protein